jgi:hypothetical protein
MDWRQGTRNGLLRPECPAAWRLVALLASSNCLAERSSGGGNHDKHDFVPVHDVSSFGFELKPREIRPT